MTSWFEAADVDVAALDTGDDLDGDVIAAAAAAVDDLEAEDPVDLPAQAVASDAVADTEAYYDALHVVTIALAERRIDAESGTPERDLVHGVRALDALDEVARSLDGVAEDWRVESGEQGDAAVDALATRTEDLDATREEIEQTVRALAETVAPTLSAIAGPVLAARLVELAGGMADLARMPSGTVQVLGAEDALFRHLADDAPPPKHGAIYLHPAVRGAPPDERGRVARSLSGKLTIAARVDHYRGALDEDVVADWQETLAAIEDDRDEREHDDGREEDDRS